MPINTCFFCLYDNSEFPLMVTHYYHDKRPYDYENWGHK